MKKSEKRAFYFRTMLLKRCSDKSLSFWDRLKAKRELRRRNKRIKIHVKRIESIRNGLIVAVEQKQEVKCGE